MDEVIYGFVFGFEVGDGAAAGAVDRGAEGDAAGVALPAGRTPTPESGTGEEAGDDCDVGDAGGAGDAWVAACFFINSRRRALSPATLLCA